jgi:hypothetical protein
VGDARRESEHEKKIRQKKLTMMTMMMMRAFGSIPLSFPGRRPMK